MGRLPTLWFPDPGSSCRVAAACTIVAPTCAFHPHPIACTALLALALPGLSAAAAGSRGRWCPTAGAAAAWVGPEPAWGLLLPPLGARPAHARMPAGAWTAAAPGARPSRAGGAAEAASRVYVRSGGSRGSRSDRSCSRVYNNTTANMRRKTVSRGVGTGSSVMSWRAGWCRCPN